MIEKNEAQFRSCIRGRKDGVLRRVEEIPFSVVGEHVAVQMQVNGKFVFQTVRQDRIERVKM